MKETVEFDGWTIMAHPEPRMGNYQYQHESTDTENLMNGSGDTIVDCIEAIIQNYYQRKDTHNIALTGNFREIK